MIEDIIPEEVQPQEEVKDVNEDYNFVTGELDPDDPLSDFLEDMRKPKEETGIAEEPEDDELDAIDPEDEISNESAKYSAEFVVDSADFLLSKGLSFISKNPSTEHEAGKEQKKYLKKLWTKYLHEKQIEIPIGTQLIIAMITVYGSQIPGAIQDRKRNLMLEQIKEERDALTYDREQFNREKENFRLKQQLEELNNANRPGDTTN